GLKQDYLQSMSEVFAKFPEIHGVILYGSRAKGNYKSYSDIDISLLGSIDLSLQNKIEVELDDLLLPYVFDVSVLAKIKNKDLVDHIERVGIPIYSKSSI